MGDVFGGHQGGEGVSRRRLGRIMSDDDRKKLLAQAKLGLDALIDEATGYQTVRSRYALAKRYEEYGGEASDYRAPDAPPENDGGGE